MPYYNINDVRYDHKVHLRGYRCGQMPTKPKPLYGRYDTISDAVAYAKRKRNGYPNARPCDDCKNEENRRRRQRPG